MFVSVLAALAIGIMLAAQLGPAMLVPTFFIPFACLSAFFVGNAQSLWKTVAQPLALMTGILGVALVLINLDPPRNRFPDGRTWMTAIAAAVLTTLLAAVLHRRLAARFSADIAKWTLRVLMFALYCFYRWMPPEWLALIQ